jgi:hypothetical protein
MLGNHAPAFLSMARTYPVVRLWNFGVQLNRCTQGRRVVRDEDSRKADCFDAMNQACSDTFIEFADVLCPRTI